MAFRRNHTGYSGEELFDMENDSDEQRIKSIVDELQAGPFTKYDVHFKIMPKKEKEEEQNDRKTE